jgi:hypothetical protein
MTADAPHPAVQVNSQRAGSAINFVNSAAFAVSTVRAKEQSTFGEE